MDHLGSEFCYENHNWEGQQIMSSQKMFTFIEMGHGLTYPPSICIMRVGNENHSNMFRQGIFALRLLVQFKKL